MDKINIFKGKRVLVTGDTGFKGSWLCIWLKKLGAEVHGFGLPPLHEKDNFNICNLNKEICHVDGDVRTEDIRTYIDTIEPDFIFHLAAQALVLESFKKPAYTFETNVMGTVNVLKAAREVDCLKSIVVVTSDKCYKNSGEMLREGDHLGGNDPYSASKACEEMVATSFYKSFFEGNGVGLSTARAGNVIGGGDRGENRIVPDCIKALENGTDIDIRNPWHVRPWQYILEPLYGYLSVAACMYENPIKYSSAWNFGPGPQMPIPVIDLAELILVNAQTLYNKTGTVLNVSTQLRGSKEKSMLTIDSSKSRDLLGVKNILDKSDMGSFIVDDYFCDGDIIKQRLDRIEQYEEKVRNDM